MKRVDIDCLNAVALDLRSIRIIRKAPAYVSIRAEGAEPLVIDTSEPEVVFALLLEAFNEDT